MIFEHLIILRIFINSELHNRRDSKMRAIYLLITLFLLAHCTTGTTLENTAESSSDKNTSQSSDSSSGDAVSAESSDLTSSSGVSSSRAEVKEQQSSSTINLSSVTDSFSSESSALSLISSSSVSSDSIEICNDNLDNDKNGYADCMDRECRDTYNCLLLFENSLYTCTDSIDNDFDGDIDCDDEDCLDLLLCTDFEKNIQRADSMDDYYASLNIIPDLIVIDSSVNYRTITSIALFEDTLVMNDVDIDHWYWGEDTLQNKTYKTIRHGEFSTYKYPDSTFSPSKLGYKLNYYLGQLHGEYIDLLHTGDTLFAFEVGYGELIAIEKNNIDLVLGEGNRGEATVLTCRDQIDNDNDGSSDCLDTECMLFNSCSWFAL